MLRGTTLTAIGLLAAAPALAAPPPPPSADPGAIPVKAGDTVSFDLSALPDRLEGEAKATCVGTRVSAIGPVEARCVRSFRFEVPPGEARLTWVFKGKGGAGRERRIELPVARERKPSTFLVPADGAIQGPAPITLPQAAMEGAAKKAAPAQCEACTGEGFRLEAVEVTRRPGADLPVRISVTTPATPATPAR